MMYILFVIVLKDIAYGQFFDRPIQYFDDGVVAKKETQTANKDAPKSLETKGFEWSNYLDEKKDEFFREGDYIPPAPFLEVVRRPTAKNILLFEKWKEKKNQLLNRYNEKRMTVLGLKGLPVQSIAPPSVPSEGVYEKLKEYRMVFYFDSECPSCKGMYQVVNQLADNGVYVEAVRLDKGDNLIEGLKIPWSLPSAKEISVLKVSAVPMLMIFEDKTKQAFKVVGKKSAEEILSIIQRVKKT